MKDKYIKEFFEAAQKLREKKIIRSNSYLGDIGEYMCAELFGIKLEESGRNKSIDGTLNNESYQIKFNNSTEKTNISLGDPNKYDYALVVLGPDSYLRPADVTAVFIFYKISSGVIKNKSNSQNASLGKNFFKNLRPHYIYNYTS